MKVSALTGIVATVMMSLSVLSCSKAVTPLVEVTGGTIEGVADGDMIVFKGIPFAAPPVGELRWKDPQPVIPWEGVRSAAEFGNSPVQAFPGQGDEDCLYLNVWTPAKVQKEKLPVMVWIYGGGFAMGSSSQYDGARLASKGVVLVTINYRVGILGFFAHPELSAENLQGVSGNYGILDQIAALGWVRDNIASFGGDPDNVTIFGESAGAISVSMLCASPYASGLFRRAISQSGGSFGHYSKTPVPGENMRLLADCEQEGLAKMQALGCSSIEEMRQLRPDQLGGGFSMAGGAWPLVDGYVIPDDQCVLYEQGKYNNVDILVGYNSDEGLSFGATKDSQEHILATQNRYEKFADALLEAYPLEGPIVTKSARNLTRDAAFGWHTWKWACYQAEQGGSKVYLYYFDQHPDYPEDSPMFGQGSPHGQDVDYVFGSLKDQTALPTDHALSDIMMTYWTNFAKTGDPNDGVLPQWPEFTGEGGQVMNLTGDAPFAGPVHEESSMKVLDAYFAWRRSATL